MIAARLTVTDYLNTPEVANKLIHLFNDCRNLNIKLMDRHDPRAWKCLSAEKLGYV